MALSTSPVYVQMTGGKEPIRSGRFNRETVWNESESFGFKDSMNNLIREELTKKIMDNLKETLKFLNRSIPRSDQVERFKAIREKLSGLITSLENNPKMLNGLTDKELLEMSNIKLMGMVGGDILDDLEAYLGGIMSRM